MNRNKRISNLYDKQYFEILTEEYSHKSYHYVFNIVSSVIQKHARKKDDVLDVGCGVGWLLKRAQDFGCNAYGMDFSKSGVKIAKERLGEGNLVVADAAHIPFRDEALNLVTCIWLLEHVEKPQPILAEVRRVLKTGGLAIFMSPSGELKYTEKKSLDITSVSRFGEEHFWEFSPVGLQDLIQKNGFTTKERRGIYRFHYQNIFTFPAFKLVTSVVFAPGSKTELSSPNKSGQEGRSDAFTNVLHRVFPSSFADALLYCSFDFFTKIESLLGNKSPFNFFGIETLLIGQKAE